MAFNIPMFKSYGDNHGGLAVRAIPLMSGRWWVQSQAATDQSI